MLESRNILNMGAIDALIDHLCKEQGEHAQAWLRSTYRTWMQNKRPEVRMVCTEKHLAPWMFFMLDSLFRDVASQPLDSFLQNRVYRVAYDDLTEWAQKAVDRGEMLWWSDPLKEFEEQEHARWREYMKSLPIRSIRHTVDEMERASDDFFKARVDERRLKRGMRGFIHWPLPELEGTGWGLYQITDKAGLTLEGKLMNHCIDDYAITLDKPIFSLLKGDHHEVTLLCQVEFTQGTRDGASRRLRYNVDAQYANSNMLPNNEQRAILKIVYEALGWIHPAGWVKPLVEGDTKEEGIVVDEDGEEEPEDEPAPAPVRRGRPVRFVRDLTPEEVDRETRREETRMARAQRERHFNPGVLREALIPRERMEAQDYIVPPPSSAIDSLMDDINDGMCSLDDDGEPCDDVGNDKIEETPDEGNEL